jgi:hypothetical protein
VSDAVWRFVRDLSVAGMGTRQRAALALIYERALTVGSAASWQRFYRALFSALRLLSHDRAALAPQASDAVESLLRIVEDDFGSRLFGAQALSRLRASLNSSLVAHITASPTFASREILVFR